MANVLKCAHINPRSLLNKFLDIKTCLLDNNFDIFAVTETWLSENISDRELAIANYNCVRQD